MVAYEPSERPTINEILHSTWMKEINDLEKEKMVDLEFELKKEFQEIKEYIKE